jgi:hypothetical protein
MVGQSTRSCTKRCEGRAQISATILAQVHWFDAAFAHCCGLGAQVRRHTELGRPPGWHDRGHTQSLLAVFEIEALGELLQSCLGRRIGAPTGSGLPGADATDIDDGASSGFRHAWCCPTTAVNGSVEIDGEGAINLFIGLLGCGCDVDTSSRVVNQNFETSRA